MFWVVSAVAPAQFPCCTLAKANGWFYDGMMLWKTQAIGDALEGLL